MVRRRSLWMIALVAAVWIPATAHTSAASSGNPHLVRAQKHKAALEYEAARASLRLALRAGTNQPAELALIYRLMGEIDASLGKRAAAIEHFRSWIAVDSAARLPVGTSPKLTEPLAAARSSFAGNTPLRVRQRVEPDPPAAIITVESDQLRLVDGVRVSYHAPGQAWATSRARGSGVLRLPVPPSPRLAVVIEVVDAHGNVVVMYGSRDKPIVVSTKVVTSGGGNSSSGRPLFKRWPLWAGLAVVLAGGTTWLALDARSAQQSLDDIYRDSSTTEYSDVASRISVLEERGKRSARLANIGLGLTGASAVAAIVFAYTGRRAAVEPTRGGATMSVALRF